MHESCSSVHKLHHCLYFVQMGLMNLIDENRLSLSPRLNVCAKQENWFYHGSSTRRCRPPERVICQVLSTVSCCNDKDTPNSPAHERSLRRNGQVMVTQLVVPMGVQQSVIIESAVVFLTFSWISSRARLYTLLEVREGRKRVVLAGGTYDGSRSSFTFGNKKRP